MAASLTSARVASFGTLGFLCIVFEGGAATFLQAGAPAASSAARIWPRPSHRVPLAFQARARMHGCRESDSRFPPYRNASPNTLESPTGWQNSPTASSTSATSSSRTPTSSTRAGGTAIQRAATCTPSASVNAANAARAREPRGGAGLPSATSALAASSRRPFCAVPMTPWRPARITLGAFKLDGRTSSALRRRCGRRSRASGLATSASEPRPLSASRALRGALAVAAANRPTAAASAPKPSTRCRDPLQGA